MPNEVIFSELDARIREGKFHVIIRHEPEREKNNYVVVIDGLYIDDTDDPLGTVDKWISLSDNIPVKKIVEANEELHDAICNSKMSSELHSILLVINTKLNAVIKNCLGEVRQPSDVKCKYGEWMITTKKLTSGYVAIAQHDNKQSITETDYAETEAIRKVKVRIDNWTK